MRVRPPSPPRSRARPQIVVSDISGEATAAWTDHARTLLVAWSAPDAQQSSLRAEYVDFIDRHNGVHLRASRIGHLTASALVVDPVQRTTLLTLHPTVGRWLQTGGHIEPTDDSLLAAAAREAREESGIAGLELDTAPLRLDRHELMCRADDNSRSRLHHWDVQYLALAAPGSTAVMSEESDDLRWWPLAALPDVDESVERLARQAAQRLGF
jgi:8-oxo-dGTP pyrophosphatase MutT (NUDIX family)